MRTFELLLILINIPYLAWGLFSSNRPKWVNLLPVGGLLLLLIHLLVEGYRWQMIPAYLLVGVLLVGVIRPLRNQQTTSKRRVIAGSTLFSLLLLVIAIALPVALPVPKLPAVTGDFEVGTRTFYLVDTNREEVYTPDANDNRELMVQIYYPAAANSAGDEALYLPELDVAGPAIAKELELPAFLFTHVNLMSLAMTENAEAASAQAPFPVIVFSHGLTGLRMQNTAMVRELVSHGYVVIAPDHTYGNALSVFPDGRVIFYE
ncbi:MAG: acetylhydrolase, partial [Chloroflexi bacterium]|nr:acetylhydrolase [Chloroflexota bacterium]